MWGKLSSNMFVMGLALGSVLGALGASLLGSSFRPGLRPWAGRQGAPVGEVESVYPAEGHVYWENGAEMGDLTPDVFMPEVEIQGVEIGGPEIWEISADIASPEALALEGRLYWEEGADLEDITPSVSERKAA